jgi:integrase
MKLREGIELYLDSRKSEGTPWMIGAQNLPALYRHVGDLPLDRIRVNHVVPILDGPLTAAATLYNKYGALRQFFRYWKVRNDIYRLPLPPPRRAPAQTFVPYVYSQAELRRLLVASGITQRDLNCVIDARTFLTLLLFLYGTGAMLGEAVQLERGDVEFRRKQITLSGCKTRRARELPIGSDLCDILLKYHRTHHQKGTMRDSRFFLTGLGLPGLICTSCNHRNWIQGAGYGKEASHG